jgi:simple sugar transport system permease protein
VKEQGWLFRLGFALAPILVALALTGLLVIAVGSDPLQALVEVLRGGFRDVASFAGVVNFWIPLTLAAAGLIVTFTAGLWNIGVDGQITMGAIFASAVALAWNLPPPLLVLAQLAAAMVGGGFWGALCGFLKTRLGVNEIFGGVALNQIASLATLYMISGPWQPPEGGSVRGSPPFPPNALFPVISNEFSVSLLMLVIVGIALVTVGLALRGTRWGLNLKATGQNARSALLLGVPVNRSALSAFIVCGMLAGIAGAFRTQFAFTSPSIRPLVSGGIGFLAVLVALVVARRVTWLPLVTFAFSALLGGSAQLKAVLRLEVALVGVLQGVLVLTVLLFNGLRGRLQESRGSGAGAATTPNPAAPSSEAAHG